MAVLAATPTTSSSASSPLASPPSSVVSDSSLPPSSTLQLPEPSSASLEPPTHLSGANSDNIPTVLSSPHPDVDPQIIEALRSKDRIYVLKLGELMESLINNQRDRINLTPSTSYQRLLVHRCSAYYKLVPESDPTSKGITVSSSSDSRIPSKRLCELVQLESIVQPAFKIMRRSLNDRRSYKSQSQTGSVTGEEAESSDVEPSESGSLGGRSNATGGSSKKRLTIEEREAAYNEARSRIFMDFEEKEKDKEKNLSASSSSVSLVSGSASTSGGGSSITGDIDEPASSPATESEHSVPLSRDKKGSRHPSRNTSSSHSLRSSAPPFNGNPHNSEGSSPSFAYANIYDPSEHQAYDPSRQSPHSGYPPQYFYPYPPSGPPNSYYGGHPYYPPYNPYQMHHPSPHSASDPSTPSSGDSYVPPPYGTYHPHYGWSQPSLQSPPHIQQPPPLQPHNTNHPGIPPLPPLHNAHYPLYPPPAPSHAYTYPLPYYPPPEQHTEPPATHPSSNMFDVSGMNNGNMMGNHLNASATPTMTRSGIPSLSSNDPPHNSHHDDFVGKGRVAPFGVNHSHSAWNYGPRVNQGGYSSLTSPGSGADTVGPRFNTSRRQPGSGNPSSAYTRSSNDEASSTASSSTTSSSSRRTYTSTTSSQHPLPPRPDWAVGLRPQAGSGFKTQGRLHDYHHQNPHTRPSGSIDGTNTLPPASQQTGVNTLQSSADFPPLTSVATDPEKRMPVASGAWGRTSINRSIGTSGPVQTGPNVPAPHPYGSRVDPQVRQDETERGFERPPPKSAELFNPKVLRRPAGAKLHVEQEKEHGKGGLVNGVFISQLESMTLGNQIVDSQVAAAACN